MNENRPLLAITMGDPAGIGPEVVLRALADPEAHTLCRARVVGDRRILERAAPWVGPQLDFDVVEEPGAGRYAPGALTLLDLRNAPPDECPVGQVSAGAGSAAVGCVERACDLALAGAADAVV